MQIDNPLKVNIGNFYLVDFEYLEDYAIMILEDSIQNQKSDKYQSMAKTDNNGRQEPSIPDTFTRTVAHQSSIKLSKLHSLQKTKYTAISSSNITPPRPARQSPGTLASITLLWHRSRRITAGQRDTQTAGLRWPATGR